MKPQDCGERLLGVGLILATPLFTENYLRTLDAPHALVAYFSPTTPRFPVGSSFLAPVPGDVGRALFFRDRSRAAARTGNTEFRTRAEKRTDNLHPVRQTQRCF